MLVSILNLQPTVDMTGINNMKPIGNNFGTEGTKLKAFSGTFDGNKHKISNLNMIYKGKNNIGRGSLWYIEGR